MATTVSGKQAPSGAFGTAGFDPRAKLGPDERADAIDALKTKELDVLVVGGGIVGGGSALDAVTRGLSVGIVEARDWGSGTSSRSSKLVHGGDPVPRAAQLRPGTRGADRTRAAPAADRPAPGQARPLPLPAQHRVWERFYIGIGMAMYDAFSWSGGRPPGVPHHRHLSRTQVLKSMPALKKDAFVGGMTYYDAQVDDARYVASLVRTAASYGAHAASRVRIEGFIKVGERVVGAHAHDIQTGERFDIRAKQVVNATGCGPTTRRRWSAPAGSSRCGRRRACTWSCPATASSPTWA